jgi:hypothetical protein
MLNPTSLTDNGAQFDVVVTNSAGSVTSAAATLTVVDGGGPTAAFFEANFDSGDDGFAYADDLFRATERPDYEDGSRIAAGGFSGGALRVILGGVNGSNISKMSGGWWRTFTLDAATATTVSFRYRLSAANLKSERYGEMLVSVDGVLYGNATNSSVDRVFGGLGGVSSTTGWLTAQIDLGLLPAGTHTLALGGYLSNKSGSSETVEVLIDEVAISGGEATPPPPVTPPTVTTPPANVTVTAPESASFSVVASGSSPLAYQWRRDGIDIPGATGSAYVLSETAVTDDGAQFDVVVSNGAGSAVSAAATLTVNAASVAPSIATPPADATVTAPDPATFTVAATGTAPLSYQWRRNSVNISGANGASYVLNPTAVTDTDAEFDVIVSNVAGSVTSAAATLTVNAAAGGGGTASFEAHFDSGDDGFTYADDVFRATSKPAYVSGTWLAEGGFAGGALRVILGGVDGSNVSKMSGGWQRSVTLAAAGPATISFRFRLSAANLKSERFGQMLVGLNGVLVGLPPNDYVGRVDGGLGGVSSTTGWQQVQIDLGVLPAGTHALVLGGYLSNKSGSSETVEVLIDDVTMTY